LLSRVRQTVPAKQAWLRRDLADWARHEDVKIVFRPTVFTVNSVKAMRVCCWLKQQGPLGVASMEPFAEAVFKAYWSDDCDTSQHAVLAETVTSVGVDAAPEAKAQLKVNTDEVIARPDFRSPTIFVGGGGEDMYFGNNHFGNDRWYAKRCSGDVRSQDCAPALRSLRCRGTGRSCRPAPGPRAAH